MNKKKNNKLFKSYIKTSAVVLSFTFIVLSCRGTDSENKLIEGKGSVKINLEGEAFEDTENLGTQASLENRISQAGILIQRNEIPFNDDFTLEAVLSTEKVSVVNTKVQASLNKEIIAATETTALRGSIRYKVVVYKSSGEYVTERDYVRGHEASTAALNLDGDGNYIFIAYSANSTAYIPSITFNNASNKTLATSIISGLTSTTDFMYFRKDMKVSGNSINYLDVILKHKLSQITTTIDASASGYEITAISANIDSNYPSYDVALNNGSISRRGTVGTVTLALPTLGAPKVVSNPVLINGETSTGKFIISSMTVGPLTKSVPFNALTDLKIIPGVKYNLNLKLNPTDKYVDNYKGTGQKVAIINGKVWMRHNLGADTNLNPDQDPSVKGLHGNYYQWGWNKAVANADSYNGWLAGWYGPNANWGGDQAWNSGTEENPIKTNEDPCPGGYRIPSKLEFESLIATTTQSNIGEWSEGSSNFSSAKVFISKNNKNVRLTFPTAGFRDANTGDLFSPTWGKSRGAAGYYRSSKALFLLGMYIDKSALSSDVHKSWGESIRCVAE